MKYGTQLGFVAKDGIEASLSLARQLGCEGLEVYLSVTELDSGKTTLDNLLRKAEQLRQAFADARMEFISLTTGIVLKHVQSPTTILASCKVAQALGVRDIRMFFAPHVRLGGPGSKLTDWWAEFDGTRDARYWMKRNAEELAKLVELSEGFDLRYVFELHHGYVINSASAAMRMLEPFPASRVGILMDPGNMVFEGNEGWRNSIQIMGDYLAYLHCKNSARVLEGNRWSTEWKSLPEGVADFGEIVTALKDINFQGYLSIEDLRSGLTPQETVGEGIRYLKGLAESNARVMPI
jgi:sugar phosphate isomerase/epimerase